MTESKVLAPGSSTAQPQGLANIPPTPGQRRTARAFLLALLVVLLGTWPFAAIKLPEVDAFVPTLAAALFVSDCVTAALLFAQFSILRQWALLVIANGYLFSALIVVAHALAFPGASSWAQGRNPLCGSTGFGMQGCPSRSLATLCSKTQIVSPTSASRNAP